MKFLLPFWNAIAEHHLSGGLKPPLGPPHTHVQQHLQLCVRTLGCRAIKLCEAVGDRRVTAAVLGFLLGHHTHVPNQELDLAGAAALFVCHHWEPAVLRSGYFWVNERLDGKSHKMLLIETLKVSQALPG